MITRVSIALSLTLGGEFDWFVKKDWLPELVWLNLHIVCFGMPMSFCITCFEYAYCYRCICGGELYCGTPCQRQHWFRHKKYCALWQARCILKRAIGRQIPITSIKLVQEFIGWGTRKFPRAARPHQVSHVDPDDEEY